MSLPLVHDIPVDRDLFARDLRAVDLASFLGGYHDLTDTERKILRHRINEAKDWLVPYLIHEVTRPHVVWVPETSQRPLYARVQFLDPVLAQPDFASGGRLPR